MSVAATIRLLLVDHDDAGLHANAMTLARYGAVVEKAGSCEQAIERMQSLTFDVVVNGLAVHEVDGIEFLKSVRTHDPDVPVILMNGPNTAGSAARALEQGAFRYLPKPIGIPELWYMVLRAASLRQSRAVKELTSRAH